MPIGREDYTERKENRINRFEERAAAAMGEARTQRKKARDIGGGIPLGQPILVGHHSEAHARADMNRINNAMSKAAEAGGKAAYYQDKADAASNNRAISGDNPEAVKLYQEKLAKLEAAQERMKAVNKAFAKGDGALKALGFTDEQIAKMKSDIPSYERKPYPAWALSNNSAEIRRIKAKISELGRLDVLEDETMTFPGGELRISSGTNRVQFIFDGKPAGDIRGLLKSCGFHWAPSEMAWQRQRTVQAINESKRLIKEIEKNHEEAENEGSS
jgi:hypothetical protein